VTTKFTPIFESSIYASDYHQFLVERTDSPVSTVDFYDPSYQVEDIIFTENTGGLKFFRTLQPFTPPVERVDFTGETSTNTARIEELYGNLLQVVEVSSCDESIFSRTEDGTSLNSLGATNFQFAPETGLQYTTTIVTEEDGRVSYSPSLKNLNPVDYGAGTFAL
jgi:hypothetical protein